MNRFLQAGLICLLAITSGCTPAPPALVSPPSSTAENHSPLVSKIWDVKARHFISPHELTAALAGNSYVILGEIHDNPADHQLQAWLIEALANQNRKPAVAFEMIGLDKARALEVFQAEDRKNAAGLDLFLNWKDSGWPSWSLYKPIADAALFNGLKITPAGLPENMVKDMVTKGRAALPPTLLQKLHLPAKIDAPMEAAMAAEIKSAHCNALPEKLIEPFVEIQFTRDAIMALSLVENDKGQGGILIAGQGHARHDYGVPWHLKRLAPHKSVATVAFTEVAADMTDPTAYAAHWQSATLPFDYIWFTPRYERADPCLVLKARKF